MHINNKTIMQKKKSFYRGTYFVMICTLKKMYSTDVFCLSWYDKQSTLLSEMQKRLDLVYFIRLTDSMKTDNDDDKFHLSGLLLFCPFIFFPRVCSCNICIHCNFCTLLRVCIMSHTLHIQVQYKQCLNFAFLSS